MEQQTDCVINGQPASAAGCGFYPETYLDWVLNDGPCVWDADDITGGFATATECYFADWTEHNWQYGVCSNGRRSGTVTIRFEPQGISHSEAFSIRHECATFCVVGLDYDLDQNYTPEPFQTIPYQGGEWVQEPPKLGIGVPTIVSVESSHARTWEFLRAEGASYFSGHPCAPPWTCEGNAIHRARLCWP